jgi:hypothetical protein
MRVNLWALAILGLGWGGRAAAQQVAPHPVLVLDHLFIFVPPGAVLGRQALSEAGINVGSSVARHEGAGTASVFAMFANAYLELVWVDSTVRLEPKFRARLERNRRASAWTARGPSPFGLGFRRRPDAPDQLPYVSRPYTAPWMKAGTQIDVLAPPVDSLPSPRVFVVPRDMGAWQRKVAPGLFVHRLGVKQVTRVGVITPDGARVQFLGSIDSLPGAKFVRGREHLVEVTFDGGREGKHVDLRPRLPVILRY